MHLGGVFAPYFPRMQTPSTRHLVAALSPTKNKHNERRDHHQTPLAQRCSLLWPIPARKGRQRCILDSAHQPGASTEVRKHGQKSKPNGRGRTGRNGGGRAAAGHRYGAARGHGAGGMWGRRGPRICIVGARRRLGVEIIFTRDL